MKPLCLIATLSLLTALCMPLSATGDDSVPELKISNGRFEPANLVVAANAPLKLSVFNAGDATVEFESFELNRERVVGPGQRVIVYLPPLSQGTYRFFDDFHRDAGQGTLTAR